MISTLGHGGGADEILAALRGTRAPKVEELNLDSMTVHGDVTDYAETLTRRVGQVLRERLVGVYLHGPAAMDASLKV